MESVLQQMMCLRQLEVFEVWIPVGLDEMRERVAEELHLLPFKLLWAGMSIEVVN